jgi:hypothetical protein
LAVLAERPLDHRRDRALFRFSAYHVTIDELEGRALDASVAQHIFKLRVEERANLKTGKREYLHAVGNPAEPGWVRVPEYSVSTGPNLNVSVWLQEQGWTRIAPTGKAPLGEVEVVYRHKDGRTVNARGSLNAAVCRVALKAKVQTPSVSSRPTS